MNENVVTQIQERLRNVYSLVTKELATEATKNATTIAAIQRTFERMPVEEKRAPGSTRQKLKTCYALALAEAETEEQIIRKALENIYQIRSIINERRIQMKQAGNKETIRRGALMKALLTSAQTLPLWIGKPGERPPPLCGAVPAEVSYVSKVGDMVAALMKTQEGDDNWILAEVLHYNASTLKYDVDDIDEEQKEKITLSRRRVIPLPLMRANPETDPDALYKINSIVMALYPQTTCFYKAVVSAPPVTHNDEYEVLFEDSNYPEGYSPALKVAQRYVIPYRDKKK